MTAPVFTEPSEPVAEAGPIFIEPDANFPTDREFWTDPDMFITDEDGRPKPSFTVQETAKIFFAKGPDWLRWRHKSKEHPDGVFILNGEKIEPLRTAAGARYYSLYDIERMAHGLAQNGGIDGAQLSYIVAAVKAVAQIYGYLSDPEHEDDLTGVEA